MARLGLGHHAPPPIILSHPAAIGKPYDVPYLHRPARRLADRHITVEFTERARQLLIDEGYDPVYGARPLTRTIQRRVLDPLAMYVLEGRFREGDHVLVDAHDGQLSLDGARSAALETATAATT